MEPKVHSHVCNSMPFVHILIQGAWSPNNLQHIQSQLCWYFSWWIFNKYQSGLPTSGMLFILSFMKNVHQVFVISEFESEWGHTDTYSLLCYCWGLEEQGMCGTWTRKQERNPWVTLRFVNGNTDTPPFCCCASLTMGQAGRRTTSPHCFLKCRKITRIILQWRIVRT